MITKLKSIVLRSNLVKNSLIIFTGNAFSSIIGLFNIYLLLKAVGVEGNGIIAIVISYSNIFNQLLNFQSYNAIIKFGSDSLEKNDINRFKQYIKQALLQDVLTAILAFIIGYICVDYISYFFKWDSNVIFYIKIFLISVLFNITGSLSGFIRLNNDFIIGSKIAISIALAKTVLLVSGIIVRPDFIYYIFVEILLVLLNFILYIFASIKYLRRNKCLNFFKVRIKFDKEFTMFNLHNNLVSTLDLPTGQMTIFIINKLLGVKEVGLYNIIVRFGSLILKVTQPVTQSLFPELSKKVSKGDKKSAYKLVKKIFLGINVLGIIGCMFVILSYKLWLGLFIENTIENGVLLALYSFYVIISSSVVGVHYLFISLNLVKYNTPLIIICNFIYLFLVFFMAIKLGLIGVILALILQAIMLASIKYIILKRYI